MAMGLCALGRYRPSVGSVQKLQGWLRASSRRYSAENMVTLSKRPEGGWFPQASSTGSHRWKEYSEPVSAAVKMALESAVPVSYPEKIQEAMRYAVFSGGQKMPCAVMCVAACEAVGGCRDRALPVACAIEMIRGAALIHDTLPCVADVGFRVAAHTVFGDGVAVLAGDALLSLAFQHLAGAKGVPPETMLRVIWELSDAAGPNGLAGDEHQDVSVRGGGGPSVAPALMGYYSLACGAIVGGASEGEVELLRRCGHLVGMMYQVVEDLHRQQGERNGLAAVFGTYQCATPCATDHGIRLTVQRLREGAEEWLGKLEQQKAQLPLALVGHAAAAAAAAI